MKSNTIKIFLILISVIFTSHAQQISFDNGFNSITNSHGKVSVDKRPIGNLTNLSFKKNHNSIPKNSFDLTISANFLMDYVFFYNKFGIEGDTLITLADTTITVSRPEGSYLLFVGKFDTTFQHTLIAKDSIELIAPMEVQVFKQEAYHTIRFSLFKETGGPLYKSVISFYFYSRLNKPGLRISSFRADADTFTLKTNNIPPYFDQEWAVKGKQLDNDGNIYLVSGELKTNQMDTTIINNPANYAYANFYYNYPDSLKFGHVFQLSTLFPDFHFAGSGGDPLYNHPFQVRIFQDTTVNISYHASTFIQFLSSNAIFYVSTQEVRITNNGVIGYFLSDREAPVYQIAESNQEVNLGLTPTYWFGKFYNKNDTIKIRSSHGRFEQLFLSQTNDALLHYDIDYQIFSNGQLIKSGKFPYAAGAPIMFLGFNPDSLTIPISPGSYKMLITDNQDEVEGHAGISDVLAAFDLNKRDKNPPNIILFQILSDEELTNIFNSENNNKVRFVLEDEGELKSIQLFYKSLEDSTWHELFLDYVAPYWEAVIPVIKHGIYSLRLFALDNSQNYIDCKMEPAFLVEDINSIAEENSKFEEYPQHIKIYPNYPNPFNSGTNITYSLPINFKSEIQIKVYNILGQEIKTLLNGVSKSGLNQLHWDGLDQRGRQIPSGIYILRLKGGDFNLNQKLLLIR